VRFATSGASVRQPRQKLGDEACVGVARKRDDIDSASGLVHEVGLPVPQPQSRYRETAQVNRRPFDDRRRLPSMDCRLLESRSVDAGDFDRIYLERRPSRGVHPRCVTSALAQLSEDIVDEQATGSVQGERTSLERLSVDVAGQRSPERIRARRAAAGSGEQEKQRQKTPLCVTSKV
jgi:hypothetical protein